MSCARFIAATIRLARKFTSPLQGGFMRTSRSIVAAASAALLLGSHLAHATTICLQSIDAIQIGFDGSGNLRLYVYAQELGGSTYLTYAGNEGALKAFQAQFLVAKATETKACVEYSPGTPSYVWNITHVAVANPSGYPF
jgi:hypothetical protein